MIVPAVGPPCWTPDHARGWIEEADALAVVIGGDLGRELGLDLLAGAPSAVALAQGLPEARARVAAAIGSARRADLPSGLEGLAEALRRAPEGGAVALEPDGLLRRAGVHPLVELRGSLLVARCLDCGGRSEAAETSPPCPACGGSTRPDVVLADELLDPRRRLEAVYLVGRARRRVVVGGRGDGAMLDALLAEDGGEVLFLGAAPSAPLASVVATVPGPLEATLAAMFAR